MQRSRDGIELRVDGPVATIAFDRPERRNAMDLAMRAEFGTAVRALLDDASVRVLVLIGRGGHFCAGGDIQAMHGSGALDAEAGRLRMRDSAQVAERLLASDKMVITAVDGCAFGGGFGIALLGDLVLVTPGARLCMSAVRIGLVPDMLALYTLPRIVGLQRARELMLTGRELRGGEALSYGIATELVEADALLPRAQAIATALAKASPSALALIKAGLAQTLESSARAMVEFESSAQGIAFSTPWHRQAAADFLARRAVRDPAKPSAD